MTGEPSSSNNTEFPLINACEDHWSWNPKDKSHEVRLNGPKNRIAHFHPNWSNGTAGVRGTRMLNGGRYYWEINVSQRIFGTRYVLSKTFFASGVVKFVILFDLTCFFIFQISAIFLLMKQIILEWVTV